MLFQKEKVIVPLTEVLCVERTQNFQRARTFFSEELAEIGYDGVIGAAAFRKVHDGLNPAQRSRLKHLCGEHFQNLQKNGSIICVGIAYPGRVIDCIDVRLDDGTADRDAWNVYARKYHKLNRFLNDISEGLADVFDGIFILPTVEELL